MTKFEIRENRITLDGYVNAVERDSRVLPKSAAPEAAECTGPFVERVSSGTFKRAIEKADDIKLLFNHDEKRILGSTRSCNLKLEEDAIGLRAIGEISDKEVIGCAKSGKLKGWSFGFRVNSDEWEYDPKIGCQRRILRDIDLIEVSILTVLPAYIATSVEVRDRIYEQYEIRSNELVEIVEIDGITNGSIRNELSRYRVALEILNIGGVKKDEF